MNATNTNFSNLRVLSLESRRAKEIAQLIVNNAGQPIVAPSTREVPDSNTDVLKFAARLLQDQFNAVIFMTGVGTRTLAQAVGPVCSRPQFVAALSRSKTVARGPKPVAALRELGAPVTLAVPEPNTWREILEVLDQNAEKVPVRDQVIAIQEHGEPSTELYAGLKDRGAKEVLPVHVYQWALPGDTGPLREAVAKLVQKEIDVAMFTASIQVVHLLQIAEEMNLKKEAIAALNQIAVASIGPVTSETLREHGIGVDLEPSHPKMGFLVKEASEQSAELIRAKRAK